MRGTGCYEVAPAAPASRLALSPTEIHFLWYFIQGSVMIPETRIRLHRAWGMCARHSLAFVAVEAAFRPRFLHGPALQYEDLMQGARAAVRTRGPFRRWLAARRLRETGSCLMCELGYGPASQGYAPPDLVAQGGDATGVITLAERTRPYWQDAVCGLCAGDPSSARCRLHLWDELVRGMGDLTPQQSLVASVTDRIGRFARSFRWEYRGTATPEDEAALASAVGWCSGWSGWLSILSAGGTR